MKITYRELSIGTKNGQEFFPARKFEHQVPECVCSSLFINLGEQSPAHSREQRSLWPIGLSDLGVIAAWPACGLMVA
jgi:hypothetical protein